MQVVRTLILAAGIVLVIGNGQQPADAASRPPLPDNTIDRLAIGLVMALGDGNGDVGRHALSALGRMAASSADGYRYGQPVVERILAVDGVQAAIRQHLRKHFQTNHRAYNLNIGSLPILSDLIVEEFSVPDDPADDAFQTIDTALRTMLSPSPRAQRVLLARATDPRNQRAEDLIKAVLDKPRLLGAIRDEALAPLQLNADWASPRVLFSLRYAAVTGAEVPDPVLRQALRAAGVKVVIAALQSLLGRDIGTVRPFEQQLQALSRRPDGNDEIWAKTWSLLVRLSPSRAAEPLADASRDEAFWSKEPGLFLLSSIAAVPPAAAAVAKRLPVKVVNGLDQADHCHARTIAFTFHSVQPVTKLDAAELISEIASAGNKVHPGCDTGALAAAIERYVNLALDQSILTAEGIRAAFAAFPAQIPDDLKNKPNMVEQLAAILGALPRLLSVLSERPDDSVRWMTDETRAMRVGRMNLAPVRAFITVLPEDHPIRFELRKVFTELPEQSLLERLRQNDKSFNEMLLDILPLVSRSTRWTAPEIARVRHIESFTSDQFLRRAAVDALVAIGEPSALLASADQAAEGKTADDQRRALKAYRQAFHRSSGADVYTPPRIEWLLRVMVEQPDRVVAALIERSNEVKFPPDLIVDALSPALGRAQREGTPEASCLAYATFGPFESAQPSLQIVAESKTGARLPPALATLCAIWLAPAEGRALAADGVVIAALARGADAEPSLTPSRLLDSLRRLWQSAKGRRSLEPALVLIADMAAATAPHLGYSLASITNLNSWAGELAGSRQLAGQHDAVLWELNKRRTVLALAAVPAGLGLHLVLWFLIVVAYPYSPAIQAHILHNPIVRKILGLGYIDILLTWAPHLRRTIFLPFVPALVGDMGRLAAGETTVSYFPESQALQLEHGDLSRQIAAAERATLSRKDATGRPVTEVLERWRGPTLLIGPSGRGKTSYLRHRLFRFLHRSNANIIRGTGSVRFPFVYLRAAECSQGVVAAVSAHLGALGADVNLLGSLLRSGRFDVYIDGLNEVERRTQDFILSFIAEHPRANVLIATQEIGANLPTILTPFFLSPLTRAQMHRFLESREPTLAPDASVRGDVFREQAESFLNELGRTAEQAADDLGASDGQPALAASFLATLANPMDLDTAAGLIADGAKPDPYRLQEQQHRLVARDFKREVGRDFPLANFARKVLDARKTGVSEIALPPNSMELLVLVRRKQVRLVAFSAAGGEAASEYVFRHDKIRDFYTHFALLGDDPTERFALSEDERFFGVFEYLANSLSRQLALELREYLVSAAVDRKDHRLSDRFVTHLRWRRLVEKTDPGWLAAYDTAETRQMLADFDALELERTRIETRMKATREEIEAARVAPRVLTAADDATLEELTVGTLVGAGATLLQSSNVEGTGMTTPSGCHFTLVAAAGPRLALPSARQTLSLALARISGPILLVINTEPDVLPAQRDPGLIQILEATYGGDGTIVLDALSLLEKLVASSTAPSADVFWSAWERAWQTRTTTAA